MNRHLIIIVLTAILIKALYLIFGITHIYGSGGLSELKDENQLLELYKRNDGYWYERIAQNGHHRITPDELGYCNDTAAKQSYYNFFPLYPATAGVVMRLLNIDFNSSGFILAMLFSISCFILFYFFISHETKDKKHALFGTMVLMLFPFNYYFSMYYSEALYLFLLLLCFTMVQQDKKLWLSISLIFLVLVRPNGMFMVIPIFLYFLEKNYVLNFSILSNRKIKDFLPVLYFITAPLTLLAYCIYLHYMTGDYLAFINARAGWCLYSTYPWEPFLLINEWSGVFKAIYLSIFAILALTQWNKLKLSFQVLIWINLILPLTSSLITIPRYISSIFIFWIILGGMMTKLSPKTQRWFIPFILIILFIGQLWSFTFWLDHDPFSF